VIQALSHLFGTFSGLEIRYVRAIYDAQGGPLVLLIPVKSWSTGTPPLHGRATSMTLSNPLCIVAVTPGDQGSGGACEPTSALTGGHLTGSVNRFEYSIVPDAVKTVVVHFNDGSTQKLSVQDNSVTFTAPAAHGPGAPPLPSSLEWRNVAGKVVPQNR
jgi:hypothetical protein